LWILAEAGGELAELCGELAHELRDGDNTLYIMLSEVPAATYDI
jgi:hypothetical protein